MKRSYYILAIVLLLAACIEENIEKQPDVAGAESGARPSFFSMVHDAAEVREFLSKGADINAKNEEGRTLLHEAAKWRKPELVKLLIESGGNVNAFR